MGGGEVLKACDSRLKPELRHNTMQRGRSTKTSSFSEPVALIVTFDVHRHHSQFESYIIIIAKINIQWDLPSTETAAPYASTCREIFRSTLKQFPKFPSYLRASFDDFLLSNFYTLVLMLGMFSFRDHPI
jgi:hypothetical protein